MKKNFLLILFIVGYSSVTNACPYCGCGNSNFQIGVLPTFSKAFFGVRYSYSHFKTDSSSQFSRDYFHTTEVWGGFKTGRLQVMAFVPYIQIHKSSDDGVVNTGGLGDVTVLANYMVLSNVRDATDGKKPFNHSVWIGAGIKLKTGKSIVDVGDPDFTIGDFTNTPGTGSTDYLLNINDSFIFGSNGLVTNIAYKINTSNDQQYKYGNRFYLNTAYFRLFKAGSYDFRPSVGVNLVTNSANRFQSQEVQYSAGYVLNGMIGLNVQKGKVGLLLNGFVPLAQNIFNGLTTFRERESIALTYSF